MLYVYRVLMKKLVNKIKIIIFTLSIILISSCKKNTNHKTESSSNQLKKEIEFYLKEQIEAHEIPGLAVAVIKNNFSHQKNAELRATFYSLRHHSTSNLEVTPR